MESSARLDSTPSKNFGTSPAFKVIALKLGTAAAMSSNVLGLWNFRKGCGQNARVDHCGPIISPSARSQ